MQNKPTPEEVKNARVAAGLTLKEAADIFGYQLNSWQMKESAGKASRSLSIGEYQYLLLLANMHPSYRLVKITCHTCKCRYNKTQERETGSLSSRAQAGRELKMKVLTFKNDTVSVGDIFVSSWGYEQTNVTFYQCSFCSR